ncbi:MAG: hypothetical protein PVI09_18100 [Anaerolineae bacterium]|jgi:hypothetical protein
MDSLLGAVQSVLSQPTPDALVVLQAVLLARGEQGARVGRALEIAGHFHRYLSELQSKLTARQYSELASMLDIGAVGIVVLENLLCADREEVWKRLALGGLAEGLMVAASRQYVKGWQTETGLVHTRATWYLTEALWHASAEMQPDLAADQRWQAIDSLLSPARDPEVPAPHKAILLGRIYQMLLLLYLIESAPAG